MNAQQNFSILKINLTRSNAAGADLAIKRILHAEAEHDKLRSMVKHRSEQSLIDEQIIKVSELSNAAKQNAYKVLNS